MSQRNIELTQSEEEIMRIFWEQGKENQEWSIRQILDQVKELYGKEWKGSTISTFLGRLVDKGLIDYRKEWRTSYYHVLMPQSEFVKLSRKKLVKDWLHGSTFSLMMNCFEDEELTEEELQILKKKIEEFEK